MIMSKAQKQAQNKFKEAVVLAKKLRAKNPKLKHTDAVKLAFQSLSGVKKPVAKKTAPRKAAVKKAAVKKAVKRSGCSSDHRDNKSHNVNIRVMSGISAIYEFFNVNELKTLDDLKKAYFKAAKIYHPDAGGTKEAFQRLQNEYETLLKRIIAGAQMSVDDAANELFIDENLRAAVDAIISIPGITIELVGNWIWVGGNTYPVRNELKGAGFTFAPVKKLWYYAGVRSSGKGNLTMEQIRKKYGSKDVKSKGQKSIEGIGTGTLSGVKRKKFATALKKLTKGIDKRSDKPLVISGIIKKIH
jgi:hypothetical protein